MKKLTSNFKSKQSKHNSAKFILLFCLFLISIYTLVGCNTNEKSGYDFCGYTKCDNMPIENVEILVNDISLYPQIFTDKNGYFSIKNISDNDKISFKHTNFFFSQKYVNPKQNLSKQTYKLTKKQENSNQSDKSNQNDKPKNPEKPNDNNEKTEKETFLVSIVSNYIEFVSTKTEYIEKDKDITLNVKILDNFNFLGWFADGIFIKNSNVSSFEYKITKDIILRAKFEKKQKAQSISNLGLLNQNKYTYLIFHIPVDFSQCKIGLDIKNDKFEGVFNKNQLNLDNISLFEVGKTDVNDKNPIHLDFESKVWERNNSFYQIKIKVSDSSYLGSHIISIKNKRLNTLWSETAIITYDNLAFLPKIENCKIENKKIHFELNFSNICEKYKNFSLETQKLYFNLYTNGIKVLSKTLNSDDICNISNNNCQFDIDIENLANINVNANIQLEILSNNCIFTYKLMKI